MCNDVPGSVEVWHIPGKTTGKWGHYRLQTRTIEHLENSTSDSLLGDVSLIQKATLELYSRNVPFLYTSRCVIARHQFTRPSPTLVLQVTNTGVRRPGYEAKWTLVSALLAQSAHTSNVAIRVCSSIHRMRVRPRVWLQKGEFALPVSYQQCGCHLNNLNIRLHCVLEKQTNNHNTLKCSLVNKRIICIYSMPVEYMSQHSHFILTQTGDSNIIPVATWPISIAIAGAVHKLGFCTETEHLMQEDGTSSLAKVGTRAGNWTCEETIVALPLLNWYFCILK